MIWVGIIVVVLIVGFVAIKMLWARDEAKYEAQSFTPQRKWAWEAKISEAEETALLNALRSHKESGMSLFISHERSLLKVFPEGRSVAISLYLLSERFRANGATPISISSILSSMIAKEEPGVVHFSSSWFSDGDVDGMDHNAFIELARGVLTTGFDSGLFGSAGWMTDENYGEIDLDIMSASSPRAEELRAQGKFEEISAAESFQKNTFLLDVGRLLAPYKALRAEQPDLAPNDAFRTVLVAAISSAKEGVGWSNVTATPLEQQLVLTSAEGKTAV